MSLIDEINKAKEESYEKWFERWYKKLNLENKILQSASEGYSGYAISIKQRYESESEWNKNKKYLARRLRDERTVNNIEKKLGDGFKVKRKYEVYEGKLIGMPTRRTEDNITILWEADL